MYIRKLKHETMITIKKNFFYSLLFPLFFLFNTSSTAQDTCDFQIQLEPDINLDLGDSVQLYLAISVPSSSIESVSWSPDSTLSCNDCLDPFASPTENVCYIAMVTDTSGCTLSDTVCIFVQPVAINNLDRSETIVLFPNPSFDYLTVASDIHTLSAIKIFNAFGQLVHIIPEPDKHLQVIRVSELDVGIYYLEAHMENYFARKKFVKH